jgi:hypothetical protein
VVVFKFFNFDDIIFLECRDHVFVLPGENIGSGFHWWKFHISQSPVHGVIKLIGTWALLSIFHFTGLVGLQIRAIGCLTSAVKFLGQLLVIYCLISANVFKHLLRQVLFRRNNHVRTFNVTLYPEKLDWAFPNKVVLCQLERRRG